MLSSNCIQDRIYRYQENIETSNDDNNLDLVNEYGITYFTLNKIKTIGINKIIPIIKEMVGNKPVHISLDMKAFDRTLAPSVHSSGENGLNLDQIECLLLELGKNIVSMDIVEFNPLIGNTNEVTVRQSAHNMDFPLKLLNNFFIIFLLL